MSKTVLIVEKDHGLMHELRESFEHRGFGVEETTDGKGAPELIRRSRPDCVVLAVDLDAGQNGYIICKKLKSEAELKTVPVIIIGDPKGFEKHQQLKTRADEYLGKPFDAPALVDRVGGLVGFPPPPAELSIPAANDADEEIGLEPSGEIMVGLESDFEMVDSLFEDNSAAPAILAPPPPVEEDVSFLATDGEMPDEKTVVAPYPAPSFRPPFQSSASTMDLAEARELRTHNTELTSALAEARGHLAEVEGRLRDLELEAESLRTDLETARNTATRSDAKELFALRDAANKKDKEVLRLKNELNAKEQELVELREKENGIDQQLAEATGELTKRDAQLKTLQARADQQASEKKKLEQQLAQSREEARGASARLSTLETDFNADHARLLELEAQLEPARLAQEEAERARVGLEAQLGETKNELENTRSQLEQKSREFDELTGQHDQTRNELDNTRSQIAAQATSFADEISALRARLANAESDLSQQERRAERLNVRLKARDDQLLGLRAALQGALQTIDEVASEAEVGLEELSESS
jgi:CheY-like chemotaxis protein